MDYRARFVSALATVPLLASLAVPTRAADDVSQTRAVSGFDRIRLLGAFSTDITAGARQTRVVVSGSRDVLGRITTEVRNDTLVVDMRGTESVRRAPKVAIALPVLRSLKNEGAGNVNISELTGGDIDIANSGAASIVASGRAGREAITLDGTGKIDAAGVAARDVTVTNNGVGVVYVRASGTLVMTMSGVGEIRYAGEPARLESHVSGIGRVGRL